MHKIADFYLCMTVLKVTRMTFKHADSNFNDIFWFLEPKNIPFNIALIYDAKLQIFIYVGPLDVSLTVLKVPRMTFKHADSNFNDIFGFLDSKNILFNKHDAKFRDFYLCKTIKGLINSPKGHKDDL